MTENDTYLCQNTDCPMFATCKRKLDLKEESSDAENGERRFFACCDKTGYAVFNLTLSDTLKGRHTASQKKTKEKPPRKIKWIKQIGRFDVSAKCCDIKMHDPYRRYAAIMPYEELDRLTRAHVIIKKLLKEYNKAGSEGWVRIVPEEKWNSQFPSDYAALYRFKSDHIEVGTRSNGHLGYWRIRTDADFDARYCKRNSISSW